VYLSRLSRRFLKNKELKKMNDFITISEFTYLYNTNKSLIYSRRKQEKRTQNKRAYKKIGSRLYINPTYFIKRREREARIIEKTLDNYFKLTEYLLPFHLAKILAVTVDIKVIPASQYLSLDMFKRTEKSLVNLRFSSNMVKCYIGFSRIIRAVNVVGYDKKELIKYLEMRKENEGD